MEEEQKREELDSSTICYLCGVRVTGTILKWSGIEVEGALMTHLNNTCSYLKNYTERVFEAAESWKEYLMEQKLKPYTDIRSFFSSCHEFLAVVASKVENTPTMKGRVKKEMDRYDIIDKEDGEIKQLSSSVAELKSELSSSVAAF